MQMQITWSDGNLEKICFIAQEAKALKPYPTSTLYNSGGVVLN
jgi:hypothetical protein